MVDQKLVQYFKTGIERGFDEEYIKSTLLKKGYNALRVKMALEVATRGKSSKSEEEVRSLDSFYKPTTPKKSRVDWLKWSLITILTIAVIVLLVFDASIGPVREKKADENLQTQLTDLTTLSGQIDERQKVLDAQLDLIKSLNTSVEEKEVRVKQLIDNIDSLNNDIKEERGKIKKILFQLLEQILQKG
ncbi:hypothetical protein GOV04_02010 [Candidatus Woesearchaeota archaeon]|nr:hypothetical protein [Candidatus Woesearchaeota archaeon]